MTPTTAATYEEHCLVWIEGNRRRWENTGNPLYVWAAIGNCLAISIARHEARTGKTAEPHEVEPFPPPDWCQQYLWITSSRLGLLAEGKDFQKCPAPIGGAEPTQENWSATRDLAATLTPTDAAQMTAQAIGVARAGWNAFERAKALKEQELDEFSHSALRAEGKTAAQAMEILLQETSITDERAMRRRLTRARAALRAKPTP